MEELYIPVNIRERKELTEGFGKKELFDTAAYTGIGIITSLLVYFFWIKVLMVLIVLPCIFGGAGVIFNIKNKYGLSFVMQVKALWLFYRGKNLYLYGKL